MAIKQGKDDGGCGWRQLRTLRVPLRFRNSTYRGKYDRYSVNWTDDEFSISVNTFGLCSPLKSAFVMAPSTEPHM